MVKIGTCACNPGGLGKRMNICIFIAKRQRILNDLYRTKLNCVHIIWLLAHPPPPPLKLTLFLSLPLCHWLSLLMRRGEGVGEEPNLMAGRKSGFL
jgi:hypothetical protein